MASAARHNSHRDESAVNVTPFKRKQLVELDGEEDGGADESKKLRRVLPSQKEIKRAVKDYVRTSRRAPTLPVDPSRVSPYPEVPGLPNATYIFALHHGGLPPETRLRAIQIAKTYHAQQKSHFLGYQCNQHLEYEQDFASYMNTHVNNIGDTFQEGNFTVNSKFMERAVLDYYAELWNAKWPHDSQDLESYWGFCLTMGSTEGNLYGMWNARDYLSGKKILIDNTTKILKSRKNNGRIVTTQINAPRLMYHAAPKPKDNPHAYTPIAFFSEDTHYSMSKAMVMLDIRTFYAEGTENYKGMCPITEDGEWPAEVPSLDTGAMDLEALAKLVEFFASRGYPILVSFNYGTTFKGAYDDVASACQALRPILQRYNLLEREVHYDEEDPTRFDVRTGYWFHVDGALGAAYMPYIEMAYNGGLIDRRGPNFDFRLPMVHSMAMSGHKWIGATVPCGLYMTRTKYQMMPPDNPEYIGTPDTTFAGSRNGLSPMLLWDNVARHSYDQMVSKALSLEALAEYAEAALLQLQEQLQTDLYVVRTPLALTVRFKRANDDICRKYSLSNEDLDGVKYSHLFAMEHVTQDLINQLIQDLSQEDAFVDGVTTAADVAVKTPAHALSPASHRLALIPSRGRGFHG